MIGEGICSILTLKIHFEHEKYCKSYPLFASQWGGQERQSRTTRELNGIFKSVNSKRRGTKKIKMTILRCRWLLIETNSKREAGATDLCLKKKKCLQKLTKKKYSLTLLLPITTLLISFGLILILFKSPPARKAICVVAASAGQIALRPTRLVPRNHSEKPPNIFLVLGNTTLYICGLFVETWSAWTMTRRNKVVDGCCTRETVVNR